MVLLCLALMARRAPAQTPDQTRRPPGVTVSGVVRDSIARMPVAAAVVQLVSADTMSHVTRSATSDSLGRFTLTDVPAGRYMIGFFHAILDSLGLEPMLREVVVDGGRPVRADLAIPSPARLRVAICSRLSTTDSGAVVVGVVRSALDRAPAVGVTVTAEWVEFSLSPQGYSRRVPRLVATTAENGWFAICNVPSAGTVALRAFRGPDSTDLIELPVPAERFLRRELYLGPARMRGGRVTGTVVSYVGSRPVSGAQVSIPDSAHTRANDRGEWTLTDAPLGTRMLEVRAVGYFPERRAVDIVAGAPPIRTALSTMQSVLDTMEVRASRLSLNKTGFEERRRSGMGRYVTPEDVARRQPLVITDLFRMVPGLHVEPTSLGETMIFMRSPFAERCRPGIYLNGHYVGNLSASGIDDYVNPDEVAGIEIYTGGMIPPQFSTGMSGGVSGEPCGSIVMWTRLSTKPAIRTSWKKRAAIGVGLAGLVLLGSLLIDRR